MNTKRPNYFTGQFLKESDFTEDQAYHIAALREHNKSQHTWGVAEGLDVTFMTGSPLAHVTEGTAIDADGKMIYLAAGGYDVDFSTIKTNATTFYIVVAFSEVETDPTSETGVTGNTRITETPVIEALETLPTHQSRKLVLAQVTLVVNADKSKSVDAVDTSFQKIAGVVAGELEARSLSLNIENADKSLWPKLQGLKVGNETKLDITTGQTDFSGQLKVNGAVGIGLEPSTIAKLQVGGAFKVTGNTTHDQNVNIGGSLSVTGATNFKAGLHVIGDASISGAHSIGTNLNVLGDITVNGNLDIKGTTTTVNTTEMEISDNIIRVNKYSRQAIPKKVHGGLEVFRGGTEPEAQIVWDENTKKWMAGKAGDLSEIPIGPLSVDVNNDLLIQSNLIINGMLGGMAFNQGQNVRFEWGEIDYIAFSGTPVQTIEFQKPFSSKPLVFVTVNHSQYAPGAIRHDPTYAWLQTITTTVFECAVTDIDKNHDALKVCWLAFGV